MLIRVVVSAVVIEDQKPLHAVPVEKAQEIAPLPGGSRARIVPRLFRSAIDGNLALAVQSAHPKP